MAESASGDALADVIQAVRDEGDCDCSACLSQAIRAYITDNLWALLGTDGPACLDPTRAQPRRVDENPAPSEDAR